MFRSIRIRIWSVLRHPEAFLKMIGATVMGVFPLVNARVKALHLGLAYRTFLGGDDDTVVFI